MNLISIPAFQDNYIWLLANQQGRCVIVDPGEAGPVLAALSQRQLTPDAILLTHHHHDHVGGVAEIVAQYPDLPVYGPQETANKGTNRLVQDGDILEIGGRSYTTIAVPGHTLGHVAFYSAPYLFCGDTLFLRAADGFLKGLQSKCTTHFNGSRNFPTKP